MSTSSSQTSAPDPAAAAPSAGRDQDGLRADQLRPAADSEAPSEVGFWGLTLGSIGVVYGDIGTSPLYAFREAADAATPGNGAPPGDVVFGVVSLILWTLFLIVTLKYVVLLLRADNNGEGGTLSLMALAQRALGYVSPAIVILGAIAAALFYGDSVITPALSVLSAVEGLDVAAPAFTPFVVPATVIILVLLFMVQSRGTARVAAFFGPVMLVWFIVLGILGAVHIVRTPEILLAFNPGYAIGFLLDHGFVGLLTLGAVFLAVTGAEALYADLGHFGRGPIRTAWTCLVLPALFLNYLGQGALALTDPRAAFNPFFLLAPSWASLPLVLFATAATIIASQAVITGTYSATRQAIQLGLLPRLEVRHTSESRAGQIYVPRINAFMLIGVLLLVALFRTSSNLAGAYGIAVSGTMVVTALMAIVVIWRGWRWKLWAAVALVAPFLALDLVFFGSNLLKIVEGGWVPLLFGGFLLVLMLTWRRGTRIITTKTRRLEVPLTDLVHTLETKPPHRVAGTAVFLTSDPESAPTALLHSLKHYKVLHERNAILTVLTANTPRISPSERIHIEQISDTFWRISVSYGFAESPNISKALAMARRQGWTYDIMALSFFLSRRSLRAAARSAMPRWQERLFMVLARNADDATSYFQIPTERVVEIGTPVTI
jgi:KUP system potassium uptake protein